MPKVIDLPTATSIGGSDYVIMESSGGGTKKITANNAFANNISERAYQGSLTQNNYVAKLTALPVGQCAIYTIEGAVSTVFTNSDSTATGLLIVRKINDTTVDFMLSVAAAGRPLYSGRATAVTTTPSVTVYKMTGTIV